MRKRTKPSESVSVSISSEDPDGIRVAHDARPVVLPGARSDTRARARWTQSTMGISSHYPQSSSDITAESSSDPSTPTENVPLDPTHNAPNPKGVVDRPYYLDPNDVSYRLRLLVKNNYYLPPAHSKPRHVGRVMEPSPPSPVKHSPAGLRDIFRVGASRARSPKRSSTSPLPSPRPALGARRPPSSELTLSPPLLSPSPRRAVSADMVTENEQKGRVVVIRERLEDYDGVAISGELGRETQTSLSVPQTLVFDPTDVVDLPSYGFEPQASIGNVLGSTSLGASALADFAPSHLNTRVMSPQDEAWRRALLMEAVDLSMSSIPSVPEAERSSRSVVTTTRTEASVPMPTRHVPVARSRTSTESSRRSRHSSLSRRSGPAAAVELTALPAQNNDMPTAVASKDTHPTMPPLSPPPPSQALPAPPRRLKPNVNPPFYESLDLTSDTGRETPWQTIRKTLSSPLLSERVSTGPDSIPIIAAAEDIDDSATSGSNYSDEDQRLGDIGNRISKDASTFLSDRHSLTPSFKSHNSSAFGQPDVSSPEPGPSRPVSGVSSFALRRPNAPKPLVLDGQRLEPRHISENDVQTPTPVAHSSGYYSRPRSRTLSDIPPPAPRSPARTLPSFPNPSSISLELPAPRSTHNDLFDSFDRTKPLTNTPTTSSSRYFTPWSGMASKRSPRIPESTFELLKHGMHGEDAKPSSDFTDISRELMPPIDNPRSDGGLGDMLKLHIEAEKDHMRRIASSMRY